MTRDENMAWLARLTPAQVAEEVKRAKEAVSEFEHERELIRATLTEVQEGLTYWQSRLDCVTEYRRVAP